jgi:hypothetical protein
MRYWLNVYRSGFVYSNLRFYTAWAESGHSGKRIDGNYEAFKREKLQVSAVGEYRDVTC